MPAQVQLLLLPAVELGLSPCSQPAGLRGTVSLQTTHHKGCHTRRGSQPSAGRGPWGLCPLGAALASVCWGKHSKAPVNREKLLRMRHIGYCDMRTVCKFPYCIYCSETEQCQQQQQQQQQQLQEEM